MKIKFILNPASETHAGEADWLIIKKHFDQLNIPYHLDRTTKPGEATFLAKKAVQEGFDSVVAIGGDGTINEVVNGIVGSQVAFGIIPAGGGNDFIKATNLAQKSIQQICEIISQGYTREIDVGLANDRYFLNMAGFGFDGEVCEHKMNYRGILKGFAEYLRLVIPLIFTYQAKKSEIKINDLSINTNLLFMAVGNGKYSGGGFKETPNAIIDDGLFDVCLAQHPGKLKVLLNLPKVPAGKHLKLSFVKNFKTKEVSIKSDSLLVAHLDGEVVKSKEFKIRILPKALKLLTTKD